MLGFDMNVIERGIRGIFGREFMTRQRKAKYPQFCTIVDSDKEEEKYNAISTLPQLTEMKDERVMSGFSDYSYTVKNKVYATGIKVPRTLFEFDQTGQLRTLVQSLGARVANFPDSLVFALMGANSTCYDSSNMFVATHNLGDGNNQTNYMLGHMLDSEISAATPTKTIRDNLIACFQNDLRIAKAMLLEINDDRGEPWHDDAEPEGLIILCHPRVEFFVRTALEATIVSDTGNLTLKSVGKVLTTNRQAPFVANDDSIFHYGTWYLMKVDTPIQPMLFQRFGPKTDFPDMIPEADQEMLKALSAVEVQTIMRAGSDIAEVTFFNDEYLFGARTIYSAGYGMWQNAVKIDGDT